MSGKEWEYLFLSIRERLPCCTDFPEAIYDSLCRGSLDSFGKEYGIWAEPSWRRKIHNLWSSGLGRFFGFLCDLLLCNLLLGFLLGFLLYCSFPLGSGFLGGTFPGGSRVATEERSAECTDRRIGCRH